jgi:hypothetical protein
MAKAFIALLVNSFALNLNLKYVIFEGDAKIIMAKVLTLFFFFFFFFALRQNGLANSVAR